MPTVPERVKAHLVRERPNFWCDACIARRLRLGAGANRTMARNVTSALENTRGFSRVLGQCANCGQTRKVTQAV